jgi:hypothetical protein
MRKNYVKKMLLNFLTDLQKFGEQFYNETESMFRSETSDWLEDYVKELVPSFRNADLFSDGFRQLSFDTLASVASLVQNINSLEQIIKVMLPFF